MNQTLSLTFELAPSCIAGGLLGVVFFGGLWWTVRRGLVSSRAALWFFASLLVRTAIVIAGFLLVCGDDWRRWLAALLGFSVARLVVTRVTREIPPLIETQHAP